MLRYKFSLLTFSVSIVVGISQAGVPGAIATVPSRLVTSSETDRVAEVDQFEGEGNSRLQIAQASPQPRPAFFEQDPQQLRLELPRQQPTNPAIPSGQTVESWNYVIFRAGGFSIWLPPGTLTEEVKTLETEVGNLSFQVIASNAAASRYAVAYSDPLTEAQLAEPLKILDALRDSIAPATEFETESYADFPLQQHPGREWILRSSDETIAFRIYLVENRLYVVGVNQVGEESLSRGATAFLNSFQLIN